MINIDVEKVLFSDLIKISIISLIVTIRFMEHA